MKKVLITLIKGESVVRMWTDYTYSIAATVVAMKELYPQYDVMVHDLIIAKPFGTNF